VSDVSLAFNVVGRDRGVNALLSRTASNVRASSMAATAGTFALRAAMASAAASAIALANSAMVAGGAVAAIPAAFAGGLAVMGAAKAVTFGMGDAWKATGVAATGGGGAVKNAAQKSLQASHAVRDATEALVRAKRDEADATKAVNVAREDEAKRLRDLSLSVAGSRLDEEAATDAVAKAAQDLAVARSGGSNYDIEQADLAYRQSQQTLVETKNKTQDLTKEQADGAKKGIEGSDAVQEALKRQKDAHDQVIDAAEQLADAQQKVETASAGAASGGIDPAAQALAKLSPNGRAVILMLRQLAPAWEAAARAGQQATFAGVASELQKLSGIYLPMATSWLTRMGGSFNTAIRQSLGLLQTKDTIRDVGMFTDNVAKATDKLALAIRPVINGIIQWVAVGSNFLPEFAGYAGKLATTFEQWSIRMRESGQAASWIRNGIATLKQFYAIALNVARSVLAVVRAGGDGGSTLSFLVKASAAMRKFTESAEGQAKIKAVLGTLRQLISDLGPVLKSLSTHGDDVAASLGIFGKSAKFAVDHLGPLLKYVPTLAGAYLLLKKSGIAAGVGLGVKVASIASQIAMSRAIKAHTSALRENTIASGTAAGATDANTASENAGLLAKGRAVIAMIAQKIAMAATAVATGVATAAQWLLNVAMDANPIGLIILAIVALVAAFVILWNKSAAFRNFWKAVWSGIKTAASAVGSWFKDTLWGKWIKGAWDGIQKGGSKVMDWFHGLGGKLKTALSKIGSIISAPFKTAFNAVARFWNNTLGRIHFTVPDWSPIAGGKSFAIPTVPMLAHGGIVPATNGGRMVIAGEAGEDEAIIPLSKMGQVAGAAGGGTTVVRFEFTGADSEFAKFFRKSVRVNNLLQTN
jgi:hypothetical protein